MDRDLIFSESELHSRMVVGMKEDLKVLVRVFGDECCGLFFRCVVVFCQFQGLINLLGIVVLCGFVICAL